MLEDITNKSGPHPLQLQPTKPGLHFKNGQKPEVRVTVAAHSPGSLSAPRYRSRGSRSSRGLGLVTDNPHEATREDFKRQEESIMPTPQPCTVVGCFPQSPGDRKDGIEKFDDPTRLFRIPRRGESDARGWERILSVRILRGFGVYLVSSHFLPRRTAVTAWTLALYIIALAAGKPDSHPALDKLNFLALVALMAIISSLENI